MRRRSLLGLPFAACILRADDRADALESVAPIAIGLSDGDVAAALAALPKDASNYDELRENITALLTQTQVTSSVEVLTAESGGAELDWYLQIRSRSTNMLVDRRRGVVRIRFRKRRLLAMEPASFFAPPKM